MTSFFFDQSVVWSIFFQFLAPCWPAPAVRPSGRAGAGSGARQRESNHLHWNGVRPKKNKNSSNQPLSSESGKRPVPLQLWPNRTNGFVFCDGESGPGPFRVFRKDMGSYFDNGKFSQLTRCLTFKTANIFMFFTTITKFGAQNCFFKPNIVTGSTAKLILYLFECTRQTLLGRQFLSLFPSPCTQGW